MSVEQALRIVLVLFVLVFALSYCEPAHGQTVTYTPLGPEVLRAMVGLIPGVAATDVEICPRGGNNRVVRSAEVYQAAVSAGFLPIGPSVVDVMITRTLQRNWRQIGADVVAVGTSAASIVTSSGVVTADQKWTTGLATGGVILGLVARQLKTRIPDPAGWRGKLLAGDIDLAGGRCEEGRIMFVRYRKDLTAQRARLDVEPDANVLADRPGRR